MVDADFDCGCRARGLNCRRFQRVQARRRVDARRHFAAIERQVRLYLEGRSPDSSAEGAGSTYF